MKIVKQIGMVMLNKVLKIIYKIFFYCGKTDEKMVVFISFHGKGYLDNPKAIYEQLRKNEQFNDYRFIWFIKGHKRKKIQIEGAKIVEYFSIPYFYYLSKAKYWVMNCKMPVYICKKKNQIYLQTWHGIPLKRLGCDIDTNNRVTFYRSNETYERMCESYIIDAARYDFMISPNEFCTNIFQRVFGVELNCLIETGYPRNDFISNVSNEGIISIKKRFNIPIEKKVILYAPTWRDHSYGVKGYVFDIKINFYIWKEILGNEYVVVFKPHYLIVDKYQNNDLGDFLYMVQNNHEIGDLYVISDILITDYSSVFFDYALLNRPIYFYMYDLKEYDGLRGFYLDIYTELPGKIYEDENEMLRDIMNKVYDVSIIKKFNKRFNSKQTGNCAQKVIDIMFRG